MNTTDIGIAEKIIILCACTKSKVVGSIYRVVNVKTQLTLVNC